MELLGHSSVNLTMNTYGHVLEEMKHEIARKTDAIFTPTTVDGARQTGLLPGLLPI
jgi:hypothetical protein